MCLKQFLIVCLLGYAVLSGTASASRMQSPEECRLPAIANSILTKSFPGWTVVSASDLTENDRVFWNSKHPYECPGVAIGDYFGSQNPAYAVTLIRHEALKTLQTLVVLRPRNGTYELIELSKPQEASRVLVTFRVKPGLFKDIETGDNIKSGSDSIAYEDIAAGVLVYAWHRDKFREIQVSE